MASSSTPPARGREIDPDHYGPGLFTEAELAAADQLVQLSGSFGWDEASSSSSSLLSVNTGAVSWKEEEVVDEKELVDRRAKKRYRLLSELYAARSCLRADSTIPSARKRKRHGKAGGDGEQVRGIGDQNWWDRNRKNW
jgi:chaperonin GroEL (HSP60 family)